MELGKKNYITLLKVESHDSTKRRADDEKMCFLKILVSDFLL